MKELGLAWRKPATEACLWRQYLVLPLSLLPCCQEVSDSAPLWHLLCDVLPPSGPSQWRQVKPQTQIHFPPVQLLYQIFVTLTRLDKHILLQNMKLKI